MHTLKAAGISLLDWAGYRVGTATPSTSPRVKPKRTKRKTPIRAVTRNVTWCTYIGPDVARTKCPCCNANEISMLNFDCGHVVSEKHGGLAIVPNLRPICKACNTSIGTLNMKDFMIERKMDIRRMRF